jgi:chromosome condensin MukBEF ATPase and DNA-binding subunit MukB
LTLISFLEFVLELLKKEKEICAEQGAKVIRDTLQNQINIVNKNNFSLLISKINSIFLHSNMLEVHCRLLDVLLALVPDMKDLEKLVCGCFLCY